jgi:hypothetical protein
MNTTTQLIAVALLAALCVIQRACASDLITTNASDGKIAYPLYHAGELSIDMFGSGSVGIQTINDISGGNINHQGLFGGGGGANFFFTRWLGVGGDYDAQWRGSRFVDTSSGNLIARLPIGATGLAPYIFGGGGYQFNDVKQSFGQAGAGLEFRLTRHVGLFADGRYVIAERTQNYGMGRAGLRISF